ncbi:uncharacterized protein CXQ87_002197 [Candidozyma duobushaemuli]|uniref:1,3-beta-glucanosyltransferase n=1 Tax=Candidozyma duobushaemuli TaxID=1231522 RepID=A0A2V1A9Z0_9ASCO|nr:uncharacterized protein CXQ87_002197 [[Candida] duobushaemulonis]PVH14073.1 hypothetical protein CXQ87_002197 [[Candida] duobushaemulonis]
MLFYKWASQALIPCLFNLVAASPPQGPIHISSNKFFDENGSQFFIKGIAYQRQIPGYEHEPFSEIPKGYIDSLAHPSKCLPDVELLKELNVNTVRVYQVDPDQDHEICMHALAKNGIYVLVDLSEPKHSINREDPSWHTELLGHFRQVVDNMSKYENVLGFIAGNEVVTSVQDASAAAFVKAAIRDTKAYQKQKGYRQIPIGYTANDDTETRENSLRYFQCGNTTADFYGINMFEWCGIRGSGGAGVPQRVWVQPGETRPFTDTDSLYGPEMTGVWSGGVAYEFFENENHFGVVHESQGRLQKSAEFDTLRLRFTAARPKATESRAKKFAPACPDWPASAQLPPQPDPEICGCLRSAVTCVPTTGPGDYESFELSSQNRELLASVCENIDCSEIEADGARGVYGRFSGCAPQDRLAWALTAEGSCDSKMAKSKEREEGSCGSDFWKSLKKTASPNSASPNSASPESSSVSTSSSSIVEPMSTISQPSNYAIPRNNSIVEYHLNRAGRADPHDLGNLLMFGRWLQLMMAIFYMGWRV